MENAEYKPEKEISEILPGLMQILDKNSFSASRQREKRDFLRYWRGEMRFERKHERSIKQKFIYETRSQTYLK